MNESAALDRAVMRVVRTQNCSGCGACTLLDPGLTMHLDEQGYNRPVRTSTGGAATGATRTFRAICPGRRVRAGGSDTSLRHPTLGPIVSCWEAWAGDPDIRHVGSSGGALTALTSWLVGIGELGPVRSATASREDPRRTVPVSITTRQEALAAAGSRYAPVSVLAPGVLDPAGAVVAKPCEISAVRALLPPGEGQAPLLLSFFCAGTPSQHATDELLGQLGVTSETQVDELWYRGRGWPGAFTAVTSTGQVATSSYDQSWGQYLGRRTQWRCKICPDGVGESADIAAADYWRSDKSGYPVFTEGDGCSALLARTPRGHELLTRAFDAGVLVGRPLDPDDLARVQPLQTSRRLLLLGRLVGTHLAGRPVPRYVGFNLFRLTVPRFPEAVRTARASFSRVRRQAGSVGGARSGRAQ